MNEKKNATLKVTFWGARGSYPVSNPQASHFGGNTACVEVQAGQNTIIFDLGTGAIALGRELVKRASLQSPAAEGGQPVRAAVFFSHLHHDHTQGLPFFGPAYLPTAELHFFAPAIYEQGVEATLRAVMKPPAFPLRLDELPAHKSFCDLQLGSVVWVGPQEVKVFPAGSLPANAERPADTAQVQTLRSYAHPGGAYAYRVDYQGQSVVYATDIEGYVGGDRRLTNFARGADLLIHDAQYSEEHYYGLIPGLPNTQGWGHSTARMACDLARAAGVRQLVLFHHDPTYSDEAIRKIESQAQSSFANCLAAYESLIIWVGETTRKAVQHVERNAVQYRKHTNPLPTVGSGRNAHVQPAQPNHT